MTTISQTIPSLGSPPLTTDPVNFDTRADTLYGTSLPAVITATNTWSGQTNTVAGEVNTNATNAQTAANTATGASAAAIAAVNATQWVSGQAYVTGAVVWSPITFKAYRANTSTSGTTDPSLSPDWTALDSAGIIQAVASGALSNGQTVIINSDGTVSAITSVGQSGGTPSVFESAASSETSIAYDATNARVVVAYRDGGNSNHGTAAVGTVSGTSISFGTPVVFEAAATSYCAAIFNATGSKVVICYQDAGNSSYGTAIVGTVSGTSVSFGTPTVFESADTSFVKAAYDVSTDRVVVTYRDAGNSSYGTAAVGTVSGTGITFGTPVVYSSSNTLYGTPVYDSTNAKVVIGYRDAANSNYGTARVGTVSGTSISFGTAAVFESAASSFISGAFDSAAGKVVFVYLDDGNSFYGTAVVGTVSGTGITFGTPVVYLSQSTTVFAASFDTVSNKIGIMYRDPGNSNYGTAVAGAVSGTSISFESPFVFESAATDHLAVCFHTGASAFVTGYEDEGNSNYGTSCVVGFNNTTLTTENYIGISNAAYSDAATATIQIVGAVDDAQLGLTPGQAYYVQGDGTLATTPDDISVFAGTAISATELIIKG